MPNAQNNKRPRVDDDQLLHPDINDKIIDTSEIIRDQILQRAKLASIKQVQTDYSKLHKESASYQDKCTKLERNNNVLSANPEEIIPVKSLTPKVNISLSTDLLDQVPAISTLYTESARKATKSMYEVLDVKRKNLHDQTEAYHTVALKKVIEDQVTTHSNDINPKGLVHLSDDQLQLTREQIYPFVFAKFILLDSMLTISRTKLVAKREADRLAREVDEPMIAIDANNIRATIAEQVRIQLSLQNKVSKQTNKQRTKQHNTASHKTKKQVKFQAQTAHPHGNKPKQGRPNNGPKRNQQRSGPKPNLPRQQQAKSKQQQPRSQTARRKSNSKKPAKRAGRNL
jgi:hypothetical protein